MVKAVTAVLMMTLVVQAQTTLETCINSGIKNHPNMVIQQNEVRMGAEEVHQARAARLPSLDFSGSYRRQSDVPQIDFPSLSAGMGLPISFPEKMTLGLYDNYDFRLTLSQPLFTGFRARRRETAAELSLRVKALRLRREQDELAWQIVLAYAQTLKAQTALQVARSGLQQTHEHLQWVTRLHEQGLAKEEDVLKAQVKRSEAELALLRAENAVELSRAALESLTGVVLGDSLDALIVEPFEIEAKAAVFEALANRTEIKEAELLEAIGRTAVQAARGALLPSVAAFASYGYGKPGLDFVNKEWMDYWLVGAGAQWTLWNAGSVKSQVQTAQLRIENLAAMRRLAEKKITLEVTEALLRLQETRRALQLSLELEQQAATSFRVANAGFRQGQTLHVDYFDALAQWQRAQLQQQQAQIDLATAQLNCLRALGRPFYRID